MIKKTFTSTVSKISIFTTTFSKKTTTKKLLTVTVLTVLRTSGKGVYYSHHRTVALQKKGKRDDLCKHPSPQLTASLNNNINSETVYVGHLGSFYHS